ncbi:MAG: hypothetical protein ACK4SM_04525 [Aquificaceae bacterium]
MKDALKLLFLIVSYNFLLGYISEKSLLPFGVFPKDLYDFIMLTSFDSALYLAWLFGYREKTVLWLGYLFLFQILGLSFSVKNYATILEYIPSFLLTLILIWLFESPAEKREKRLLEEKDRIQEELQKNRKEIEGLIDRIKLSEELVESLKKGKNNIEEHLLELKETQDNEREQLTKEREELSRKIEETEIKLRDYTERVGRLTQANRKLFELLEALQRHEDKDTKGEIAHLRKERKKLVKEVMELQNVLEEVYSENTKLKLELSNLRAGFESLQKERDMLKIDLQSLKKSSSTKLENYREFFGMALENIQMEERALEEFIRLSFDKRREFMKELLLLNMKDREEHLERMKGLKGVFKLKPKGGRIYFTYGESRRWKVLGFIGSEDDKDKDRYAREVLLKYKN